MSLGLFLRVPLVADGTLQSSAQHSICLPIQKCSDLIVKFSCSMCGYYHKSRSQVGSTTAEKSLQPHGLLRPREVSNVGNHLTAKFSLELTTKNIKTNPELADSKCGFQLAILSKLPCSTKTKLFQWTI